MIYVTQGLPDSIGPEIFLKSVLLLTSPERARIIFFCDKKTIETTLSSMKIEYVFSASAVSYAGITLGCEFVDGRPGTRTMAALLSALDKIRAGNAKDILLTLPSSKNEFIHEAESFAGHTEFFRHFFHIPDAGMFFKSPSSNILLLTDHVSLQAISHNLTKERITEKVALSLTGHAKYFGTLKDVVFAGINPHAGENGILGTGEEIIEAAIIDLRKRFTATTFSGPFAGDSLTQKLDDSENQLLVYSYHDQGLASFKSIHGLMGLNLSLGLPFLRMSVDHGTATALFGKNQALYHGCLFMLKEALRTDIRG